MVYFKLKIPVYIHNAVLFHLTVGEKRKGEKSEMKLGQKIKFLGRDAIVLIDNNHEVLIHTGRNNVKWVDKKLIDVKQENGY